MNVLVISGSSRRNSLNTRLGRLVAELRPADTVAVVSDLHRLPFYGADLEAEGTPLAVPQVAADLTDLLADTLERQPLAVSA